MPRPYFSGGLAATTVVTRNPYAGAAGAYVGGQSGYDFGGRIRYQVHRGAYLQQQGNYCPSGGTYPIGASDEWTHPDQWYALRSSSGEDRSGPSFAIAHESHRKPYTSANQ